MVAKLSKRIHRSALLVTLLIAVGLLSGCGILFGSDGADAEDVAADEARVIVPTFTPTPQGETVAEAPETEAPAQEEAAAETQPAEAAAEPPPTATQEPEPTATPAPLAKLVVSSDIVNVRNGPGTTFGLVGSVEQGTELAIIGKNPEGDWWQICCVNGEQGWLFGQLASVENTESVEVAQNIPTPPPLPTQPPAPPTNTPEPAPPPAPAGDPDMGPCGGDDGCKFKVRGGPSMGANGGLDLKMQLLFVHGGRGDEAQGSYFLVLKKDGARLPIPDSVRSIAKAKTPGQLGEYNYEFAIGSGNLPGGSVAGNYVGWVLDGNGERDSEPFSFSISDGQQGLLWIKFDQS